METGDPEALKELVLKLMAWMTTQLEGLSFLQLLESDVLPRCCLLSSLQLRRHTAFTNSDGMLHVVVPRHQAV